MEPEQEVTSGEPEYKTTLEEAKPDVPVVEPESYITVFEPVKDIPVEQDRRFYNRRKGPDLQSKLIMATSVMVWGFMLAVLLIIEQAKPQVGDFFSRLFGVDLNQNWDYQLLTMAFCLSIFMLILSIFVLFINHQRHRRKTDRYSRSLIINIIFCLGIIIFYFSKI